MTMTLGPNQVVVLDYTTQLTHVFTYPDGTEDIELWVEDKLVPVSRENDND